MTLTAPADLAALAELAIDGFRLSAVNSDDVEGLVISMTDPSVNHDRWHLEGAHHVAFPEWGYLVSMRPSFAPLRSFSVSPSPEFVARQLACMPASWFSAGERESMRRVALFDHELATPVLELIAPTATVQAGPLRIL